MALDKAPASTPCACLSCAPSSAVALATRPLILSRVTIPKASAMTTCREEEKSLRDLHAAHVRTLQLVWERRASISHHMICLHDIGPGVVHPVRDCWRDGSDCKADTGVCSAGRGQPRERRSAGCRTGRRRCPCAPRPRCRPGATCSRCRTTRSCQAAPPCAPAQYSRLPVGAHLKSQHHPASAQRLTACRRAPELEVC